MARAMQLTHRWLAALVAGVLVWGVLSADAAGSEPRRAVVIELDGAIGPGAAGYILRSLRRAQQQHAAAVILRLDTPGGLDSAMRDIIRAMLASPIPVLAYVAPSGARAASAGTYVLYAAALAAMAPGTNLGAATPVSLFGPTPLPGPATTPAGDCGKSWPARSQRRSDALSTKVTNDSVAYIRALAVLHGRNADWAEKAVREAVSLPYDAALDQHVIDLIAADVPDLLAKADGRSAIVQGKPVRLATQGVDIVRIEPSWRDRLLGLLTDPSIVYLLLLAGSEASLLNCRIPACSRPAWSAPSAFCSAATGSICCRSAMPGWRSHYSVSD